MSARQMALPGCEHRVAIVSERDAAGREVASWCETCGMEGRDAWAEILERRNAEEAG